MSNVRHYMANAVGLGVLLLLVIVLAKLFPFGAGSVIVWGAIYLVLAAIAWHWWHEQGGPSAPLEWLVMLVLGGVLGLVSFLIDVSFGHSKDPSLSYLAAAEAAGSPFGFGFTVTVFPAVMLVAVAGLARAVYVALRSRA